MAKEINLFEQDFTEIKELQEIQVNTPAAPKVSPPSILTSIPHEEPDQKLYTQSRQQAKRIIEALLFASNEPLPFQKIREIIDPIYPFKPRVINEILRELQIEYHAQQRSFQLEEVGPGYLLRTRKEYRNYIEQLYREKRGEKLSSASVEVLAIIAYRQPITRPQIDAIRGVDCSGSVQNLLERELIEPAGKLEAPGRPTLYRTSKGFLQHFGLNDLKDLPKISSLQQMQSKTDIPHGPVKN